MQSELAEAIHEVRAETVSDVRPTIDVRALLHDEQQKLWDCTSTERNVLGGRQGGKTFVEAVWGLYGCLEKPGSINPYLALTKSSARYIMWPEVVKVAGLVGIDSADLHEHTMTVKLGESLMVCAGTDDQRTIETWRGSKMNRPSVDEMGSQPESFIAYFVKDIVWPAMIKFRGSLLKCGTPRPILEGFWYDQTGPHRDADTTPPLYRWTVWDNPAIEDPDAFIDEFLRSNGLTRESVTYRREWLAEWIEDLGALVFPFVLERNGIDELPTYTTTGVRIEPERWRYVIGVDVGVVDSTAISIVGSHPMLLDEYVVHTEAHTGWISGQLADRLREIKAMGEGKPYSKAPIVLDTGGMGKLHAEELTRRYALSLEPAEKREKESNVRETRDRLIAGRIKLLNGPELDALRDEWSVLGWDDDKRLPNDSQADHVSDATLYALRRLRHYTRAEPKPGPKPGTPEWYQAERDAMFERQMRKVKRSNRRERRPQWDR